MAYEYSELLAQARQWAQMAQTEGRLTAEQGQRLLALDEVDHDQLFAVDVSDPEDQPLIVAFMGGTGVGKSSLLNRLAGQAIARAGVERPTSREVTLYHHRRLSINKLPSDLPVASIKISQHDDADNAQVVWIDMPDFDSVELANKRLVLEWLPHIDVLLYVVSPERYRDNKAWQLLLAEGGKHAWLFVMNQWDRGQALQYDDFRQQLLKAGFSNPLIFRTSCSEPDGDEFIELQAQLRQLSGRHNQAQLEQRGDQWRRQQLKQSLQQLHEDFSVPASLTFQQNFDALWRHTESDLQLGLAWPIKQLSQFWADHLGQASDIKLWDEWSQQRLNDLLDELVLQTAQFQVPSKVLKLALQNVRDTAGKTLTAQAELAGRQALLNPGNGVQRFLLKLTAIAETLLPLLAMATVGYQVFGGYYQSTTDMAAYLGVDFAIHSVLLIALSWLIPFFLHKKIQPSLQAAAYKGLQQGLKQALAVISVEIRQILQAEQHSYELMRQQLQQMIKQCETPSAMAIEKDSLLDRVLLK